jgi:hypothetical protein
LFAKSAFILDMILPFPGSLNFYETPSLRKRDAYKD